MPVIQAEFDSRVFVPCEPVEVAVGTRVEVIVPPRKPTEEERRWWEELRKELDATEPYFPTVEDAMRYSRKRP